MYLACSYFLRKLSLNFPITRVRPEFTMDVFLGVGGGGLGVGGGGWGVGDDKCK